jgi:tetratricopeptide (TPR) repeat protein
MSVVACDGGPSAPDIDATIEAGVKATRVAEDVQEGIQATQWAIQATEEAPYQAVYLYNVAKGHDQMAKKHPGGHWDEMAIRFFGQAIEFDPNYAMAYFDRGMVYLRLGQHAKAAADKAKACSLDSYWC